MAPCFFCGWGTGEEGEAGWGLCQNGRLTSIASGRIALSEPCKGEFAIL